MRRRGLAAVATVAAMVAGGCGQSASDGASADLTAPEATASDTPAPTPSGTPSGNADVEPGAGASDLAGRAEALAGAEPTSTSIAPRSGPVLGADLSWPQCRKGMGIAERPTLGMPMPIDAAEYVVIGLTNGPAFTPNPCLADQVRWAKRRDLLTAAYAVTSFPDRDTLAEHGRSGPYDGSTRLGALRNVGFQQAAYNMERLARSGLETPVVWIDVEPVPAPYEWSDDPTANAAVVEGVMRGYRDAGYRIGFYSNTGLWEQVVGDFSPGLPEWRATGDQGRAGARAGCEPAKSFQGGEPVMGQWLEDRRDHNITCPGIAADLGRWFHAN